MSVGFAWTSAVDSESALYDAVRDRIAQANEQVVIVRSPTSLVNLGLAVSSTGRSTVAAGTLMYWELRLEDYHLPNARADVQTRELDLTEAKRPYRAVLEDLVLDSFGGYTNHYAYNPLFDKSEIAAGYAEWVQSALSSPAGWACVAEMQGRAVGVATVTTLGTPEVCEIEIAGISSAEQGRGIYAYLFGAVVQSAKERGMKSIVISTQSHNINVQRAWASIGLKPMASIDTTHFLRA
jgi:GNAT superfamily N-acetyltransferase